METLKKSLEGLNPKESLEKINSYKHEHLEKLRMSEMAHHMSEYENETGLPANGLLTESSLRKSPDGSKKFDVKGSFFTNSMGMSEEMSKIKERVRKNLKYFEDPELVKSDVLSPIETSESGYKKKKKNKQGIVGGGGKKRGKDGNKKPNENRDSVAFENRIRKITDSIILSDSDCEMHSDPESETTPLPFDLPKKEKNSRNTKSAKEYVENKKKKHEKKKHSKTTDPPFQVFLNKKKSLQIQPASAKEIRFSSLTPPSPNQLLGSPNSRKTVKQRNLEAYLLERKKNEKSFFKGIKARKVPKFIQKSRFSHKSTKASRGREKKERKVNKPSEESVKLFKARALPITHQKSWREIQEEQEVIRKARKTKRIRYHQKRSKLPPRMRQSEQQKKSKYNNRATVKPLKQQNGIRRSATSAPKSRSSASANSTFQHKQIPNFEALHEKFENKLKEARKSVPLTVSKPFRFGDGGQNISESKMNKVLIKMERDRVARGNMRWPHHPFSPHCVTETSHPAGKIKARGSSKIVKTVSTKPPKLNSNKSEKERRSRNNNSNNNNDVKDSEGVEIKEEQEEEDKTKPKKDKIEEEEEEEEEIASSSTTATKTQKEEEEEELERSRSRSRGRRKPPFQKSHSESSVLEERLTRSIILRRGVVKTRMKERETVKKEREAYLRELKRKRKKVGRSLKVDEMTDRLYTSELDRFRKRFKTTPNHKKRGNNKYMYNRGGTYVIGKHQRGKDGSSSGGKRGRRRRRRRRRKEEKHEMIGLGEDNMFFDFYDGLHGQITQKSNDIISDFAGKYNVKTDTIHKIISNDKQ